MRVAAIERIRSLAMLGVLGIHTGAWSLSQPAVNLHVFALLEIVSRFSVPVFFFISAFGLHYSPGPDRMPQPAFSHSRILRIAVPYLVWSLLYMSVYSLRYDDNTIWLAPRLYEFLLFGLASYQLYFLVLLLVFTLCTPLLTPLAVWLAKRPLPRLGWLLVLQIAFNLVAAERPPLEMSGYWTSLLVKHRLNFLPLYYLWIYLLGAVFALNFEQWQVKLSEHKQLIRTTFWASLASMLAAYYWVVFGRGWSLEQAAFTIHQLCPLGVIYTGATALYLSQSLSRPLPAKLDCALSVLASHSFFIFLVHPFVMTWLADTLAGQLLISGTPAVAVFYLATLAISLTLAVTVQLLSRQLPLLALVLTGKSPGKFARRAVNS